MEHLIFISGVVPTEQEERVKKFVTWMGVHAQTIVIDGTADPTRQLLAQSPSKCCLVMTLERLTALHTASLQPAHLRRLIDEHCAGMLIFDCSDSSRHGMTLSWLTDGAVWGVTIPEGSGDHENTFHFSRTGRSFSKQFAGLDFSLRRSVSQPVLELKINASSAEVIMLANGRPAFVCVNRASCQVFLLAGLEIPDLDEPLSSCGAIEEYYDQLIPLLIFFRYCFGRGCWNGSDSTARVIIDDPLLADRYGFLDYRALLSSMLRAKYGTSIAFIPWNHHRTSRRWAKRILGQEAYLSICVHGCDHTNKEFETLDREVLMRKAGLALARMERHRARTGLPFEDVMVFPQGRFSTQAVLALRANNYLAAVNTNCSPTDDGPESLRMADFLRPAITRFYGFPIFQRRYPRRLIDFAFDVFVGKPALLVEHHEYFRHGCNKLEEFLVGLHKAEPDLSWPTLPSQLMRSCMRRRLNDDACEVLFFTRRFRLKNSQMHKVHFLLKKHEPDLSLIRTVFVDGNAAPFRVREDLIELDVEAQAGQTREIEILDHPRPTPLAKRSGVTYTFGVLMRRCLSEFRDNILSRHPTLLNAAKGVVKGLNVTGD
jgi:hypothetical protein